MKNLRKYLRKAGKKWREGKVISSIIEILYSKAKDRGQRRRDRQQRREEDRERSQERAQRRAQSIEKGMKERTQDRGQRRARGVEGQRTEEKRQTTSEERIEKDHKGEN